MNKSAKPFRVIPLAGDIPRLRRWAPAGAPDAPLLRKDGEPHQCRSCLTWSLPDEECLLFSHSPFPRPQPYAETGPIFIHRRECAPYAAAGEFPAAFRKLDLVLRAYGANDEIVGAAHVGRRPVEAVIAVQFENPAVVYLHARNTSYGCFICRIERA